MCLNLYLTLHSLKVQRTLQVVFIKFRNHDEEASTVHIPLFVTNVLLEVTVSSFFDFRPPDKHSNMQLVP